MALGQIVGGILGLSSKDNADWYDGVIPPSVAQQELVLERMVQEGILTPEDAEYFAANPTAFETIATDPALQDAQMNALMGLQDVAQSGGLNAQAKARLADIAKEEGVRERGGREAIMQQAQARGQGGSGFEMLNLLKNQQESAGRASDRGTQVSADAEARALEALMNSGQMAGNMRSQEFNEKAKKAEAIDALNRFNVQNQTSTNRFNVANRNAAQESNLSNRQRISDANVGLANKQQTHNKDLLQQQFNNQLNKANAVTPWKARDEERKRKGAVDLTEGYGSIMSGAMGAF
jgi:hypothetical protein